MIDLAIVVEGNTEELFVKRVLAPSLYAHDANAWPIVAAGSKKWTRTRLDLERLFKQRPGRRCAIMFDYYGLRTDWPGRMDAPKQSIKERGRFVEEAISKDLAEHMGPDFRSSHFIPHIQLHEYEAKLFSDCSVLAEVLQVRPEVIEEVVEECGSPEQINDNVLTAPSKRLIQICKDHARRGYRKTSDGIIAAERITLEKMVYACPHFNSWVEKLKRLSKRPS